MGFGMFGGMFLFGIVVIALAVLLVRGLFQSNHSEQANKPLTAHQIVEQRYARGELTQEQYYLMLKDIQ